MALSFLDVPLARHPHLRHLWIRKASSRVTGAGMALPSVTSGMWSRPTRAAELSYALFMQLEAEGADEALCLQAVKGLVQVAVRLKLVEGEGHLQQEDEGEMVGQPEEEGSSDGEDEGEGEDEDEGEDKDEEEQAGIASRDDDGDDGGRDVVMLHQVRASVEGFNKLLGAQVGVLFSVDLTLLALPLALYLSEHAGQAACLHPPWAGAPHGSSGRGWARGVAATEGRGSALDRRGRLGTRRSVNNTSMCGRTLRVDEKMAQGLFRKPVWVSRAAFLTYEYLYVPSSLKKLTRK